MTSENVYEMPTDVLGVNGRNSFDESATVGHPRHTHRRARLVISGLATTLAVHRDVRSVEVLAVTPATSTAARRSLLRLRRRFTVSKLEPAGTFYVEPEHVPVKFEILANLSRTTHGLFNHPRDVSAPQRCARLRSQRNVIVRFTFLVTEVYRVVRLARWRRMNRGERERPCVRPFGVQELDGIFFDKLITAIVGMRFDVNANDVKSRALVSLGRTASTAIQVKKYGFHRSAQTRSSTGRP